MVDICDFSDPFLHTFSRLVLKLLYQHRSQTTSFSDAMAAPTYLSLKPDSNYSSKVNTHDTGLYCTYLTGIDVKGLLYISASFSSTTNAVVNIL